MLYFEATKRETTQVSILCDTPALQAAVFGHLGPVSRATASAAATSVPPAVAFAMVQRRRVTGLLGDPGDAHPWLVEHHLTHPEARRCPSCAHRLTTLAPQCDGCIRPNGQHSRWAPGF